MRNFDYGRGIAIAALFLFIVICTAVIALHGQQSQNPYTEPRRLRVP